MSTTLNQFWIFLTTLYGGLLIGLVYDILRIIRRSLHAGKWLSLILDLVFWVLSGIIAFATLYYANGGELRFFALAGFCIGFSLYLLTLGRLTMYVYKTIIRFLKSILARLKRIKFFEKLFE